MTAFRGRRGVAGLLAALTLVSFVAGQTLDAAEPHVTPRTDGKHAFSFSDVGDSTGLYPHVAAIRGHGAAWGDIDGDGWPDLFVAAFHAEGSKRSMFFRNDQGKFRLDGQELLRTSGNGSGGLFVDLTNSGRLDLYVSNCAHMNGGAVKEGVIAAPSRLFRNDGGGKFTDISKECGACPSGYCGRGLTALDFDADGLLDLLTCEQFYSSKVKVGPALFHNKGSLRFENVSGAAGLPVGLGGLSVTVGDVNNDSWPDIFLTQGDGDHRLLLADGKGKYREAPGSRNVFHWSRLGLEDMPAGVCIADINRDGLADVVIGNHFVGPWLRPAPVRLYLNRGVKEGVPTFEEITEAAGLKPLTMKAPHVEIQDFDNDGWPDLYVSIVKFRDGKSYPLIYKNLGMRNGIPQFREDAWGVNDFPTVGDTTTGASDEFYKKFVEDQKIMYMSAGPSCDFDRDGRLDLFMANWWLESRSLLLHNETPGGNWLDVRGEGSDGVNRMGIGAKVNVYESGKIGIASALVGSREICIGYGYCSGQEAVAHFGLGQAEHVDVEIVLPHGRGIVSRKNVRANQHLTVKSSEKN